ncbi:MAG TPA: class I SAM-dependent methyltransferase [Pricia sp.]|nr:class I SAM-dependent methyltransferase [Pricia sp.]
MKPVVKTKDFSVTGEEFELFLDEEFEMLVTRPQPENLDSYYQSDAYISHTDATSTLSDKIYQRVKTVSLRMKTRLINKYANGNKSVLDVGAGTGDFLVAARKSGWSVTGVEPNPHARLRSQEKKMELLPDLESLPQRKFQVITLWHVLEHLPDLENQITKLRGHLEDEGTLIIAVPNFKSYDAEHYREFWAAYDVPRHLWHFSRIAIEALFSKHDLKVVDTRPMVFDAFYVSLLSEKYKTGRPRYFKAFWVGLVSNISGWFTKEYSSIIYILQRA